MIRSDMPIPDVAKFLLPATAKKLDKEPPELQVLALASIRVELVKADQGPPTDPLTLGERLHDYTCEFLRLYKGETLA